MSSARGVANPKCRSDWEESTKTINNANIASSATGSLQALQLQLLGIIALLLVVLVVVVPVTIAITGYKTTTTVTTTITTRTTITTTTVTSTSTSSTTMNPYICGNMTILLGTDLPGNDINSTVSTNYSMCCTECLSMSTCLAFTWTNGDSCYLKSLAGTNSSNSNLISAKF